MSKKRPLSSLRIGRARRAPESMIMPVGLSEEDRLTLFRLGVRTLGPSVIIDLVVVELIRRLLRDIVRRGQPKRRKRTCRSKSK